MTDFNNSALLITGLGQGVQELDIYNALQNMTSARFYIANGEALIRDYSPQLKEALEQAFPGCAVQKVGRRENIQANLYQAQIKLQRQIFESKNPDAQRAFVIVYSTQFQTTETSRALTFARDIFQAVPFQAAKVITSVRHQRAFETTEFTSAHGPVALEVFKNENKNNDSFKQIQIKGWISRQELPTAVDALCTLQVIPQIKVYAHEKKMEVEQQ